MSIIPPFVNASKHPLPDFADEEQYLLARFPHLARPGPQLANQIGTMHEQLARAKAGRHPQPLPLKYAERIAATIEAYSPLFRPIVFSLIHEDLLRVLADQLPDAVNYLFTRK